MARFLIVEARFYDHLNDQLIEGARAALEADGHEVEVLTVHLMQLQVEQRAVYLIQSQTLGH